LNPQGLHSFASSVSHLMMMNKGRSTSATQLLNHGHVIDFPLCI
jgi:hypothetical protein